MRTTTAIEIEGKTYHVAKLTLGGRRRIQQEQQAVMFGDAKIAGSQIRQMVSGGGANFDEVLAKLEIPVSQLFGTNERQQALLIKECICKSDGSSLFVTVDEVLDDLDGEEADRMLRAIEALSPPVNPTPEAVEAIAGNSEATT